MLVISPSCMLPISSKFSVRADKGTYFGGFFNYQTYHLIAYRQGRPGYCLEIPVKNQYGIGPIHVHCNDRNEGKHRPEYHSLRHTGRIWKQVVTRFAFCSDCHQILYNFLLILVSVSYSHQWHRYGNHSMYVNLLTGNRTASQKGGIIQEMPYRKCLV